MDKMNFSNQLFKRVVTLRLQASHCQGLANTASAYSKNPEAWKRDAYKYFLPLQTRWSDNDQYGHVNNVIYYSYFDTVVNHYLIQCCGLDTNLKNSSIVGYMVDTGCTFRKPLSFPDNILAGMKVQRLGQSSVTYQVAIFERNIPKTGNDVKSLAEALHINLSAIQLQNFSNEASAVGHCVHVFVHPETNTSHELPQTMRTALEKIL